MMKKQVKRILISLILGILIGSLTVVVYKHLFNSETWLTEAFLSGWFFALGHWAASVMKK